MTDTRSLYLDLMKRCLTDLIYADASEKPMLGGGPFDPEKRITGSDIPSRAHTMIGIKRLDNLQFCVEDVLRNGVPGDLIETGVWKGGATIFMRAILKAYGVTDRTVWVADSFSGLPPPDAVTYPADEGLDLHKLPELAIPLEQVQDNFRRYALLDAQVRFLKGWFRDTLPAAAISQLAVMRLDGDLYQSTMEGLVNLYPKLSRGGYVIVDDYGCYEACRRAVHDFRHGHGVSDPIQEIDWTGVFWRRS
jgi:hypothetical protein